MKTVIVQNIRISAEEAHKTGLEQCIKKALDDKLGTKNFNYKGLHTKSLDARRKGRLCHVVSARVEVDDSYPVTQNDLSLYVETKYEKMSCGERVLKKRPVIAGSGPCGLFCAYLLAIHGFRPLVLERGRNIERRRLDVAKLWNKGDLDENSNAQFGEGGAGTFSDGKLVTRINDPRCGFVTDVLMENGAPEDIAYEARPHIGTDLLQGVVGSIRDKIKLMGGEFLYETKLSGIQCGADGIKSVYADDTTIETDILVLAIGHSARDTYGMLYKNGVDFIQKPFSAGVRIEHLQKRVDEARLGRQSVFVEEPAEYMLSARPGGRGVYTFCMCPGGTVINAASEKNGLVVNGMSNRARSGLNANSAWVAEVKPSDFGSSHPLAGIDFQVKMENDAYNAGGGGFKAPVQMLGDFLLERRSGAFKSVHPSYTGMTSFADINGILPVFIRDSLKAALPAFANKLKFFDDKDAVLTGSETRTSAPVRMTRNENFESTSIKGIYPAGEGAGYAGGIMSSAVDGLRVAESIIKLYNYRG